MTPVVANMPESDKPAAEKVVAEKSVANSVEIAGLKPWLPWPLSASYWWTHPVSAERLAILRIGLSLCLLVDLWVTYRPNLQDFFGAGSLGDPELFAWYAQAPRWSWSSERGLGDPHWNWSVLRGVGDPLFSAVVALAWLLLTLWLGITLIGNLCANSVAAASRLNCASRDGQRCWRLIASWLAAGVLLVLGVWSRALASNDAATASLVPFGLLAVAAVFLLLESWRLLGRAGSKSAFWWLLASCGALTTLAVIGMFLPPNCPPESLIRRLLGSWQREPSMLESAFWIWFAAALGLLFGLATRFMAIVAWILSVSFAHVNPYIDNAGDVVRGIILFYLMLCPCGAAWSIDAWLRRRRLGANPIVLVWPWPLRLFFVQMTLIYFLNGVYKLYGDTWLSGDSVFLVLGDVNLIRFPHEFTNLPYAVTIAMTWIMLAWEVGFPLWVALPWTRAIALIFGVLFHLGILLTMELGGFGPYMLTLYLPLLPLKRWREQSRAGEEAATASAL